MTAICLWVIVAAGASTLSITMIFAAVLYSSIQWLHHYTASGLPASEYSAYYLSAVSIDAFCVLIMLGIAGAVGKDWNLWPISIILVLSIVNDIYGYVAWKEYASEEAFNAIGYAIYAAIALVLAGSRFSANLAGIYRCGVILRRQPLRRDCVDAKGERKCQI